MKLYKYCLLLLPTFALFGCEKETEGVSKTTYYCELELKGDAAMFVGIGDTYEEPGYTATENEQDASDAVVVSGTVNTAESGIYTLTYTAYNQDGFPKVAQREVFVYDKTTSTLESGYYYVSSSSNRNGSSSPEYASEPVLAIYQTSPGVFYVSDLFGGYYHVGRGYGDAYATSGTIKLDGTSLSLISSENTPWEDTFASASGTYDASTKTLTLAVGYASYIFNLTIVKK
ncbi:MAG: DUF5012 domain-containing protein [Prevotellaceae bacterium]|jgi:hypothetical protein|nr:DUF5012 domain-containing protein [Prevotellaceae bacterium]